MFSDCLITFWSIFRTLFPILGLIEYFIGMSKSHPLNKYWIRDYSILYFNKYEIHFYIDIQRYSQHIYCRVFTVRDNSLFIFFISLGNIERKSFLLIKSKIYANFALKNFIFPEKLFLFKYIFKTIDGFIKCDKSILISN